ncbi:MAG: hypothetical protein KAJ19_06030 [Gammaproteobacteria bacterium]|nr:hypothetical protein [Gammaproteobacteria bacterium]
MQALLVQYQVISEHPSEQGFGLPLDVISDISKKRLSADVFGVIEIPYTSLAGALGNPDNWCDFMPLTLNIKACTTQSSGKQTQMTFYAGRKFYEPPEKTYALGYDYQLVANTADYMEVTLSAEKGPFGTKDYQITIEATRVGNGSFIRIHSSYQPSVRSRMGTSFYLATLGHGKVGFTVTGKKANGEPVYVGGVEGVIERNAMRYYLALKSYFDTLGLPEDQRFEARINNWFDLTEHFAIQLHELNKTEYLVSKRKERKNQLNLQKMLNGKTRQIKS